MKIKFLPLIFIIGLAITFTSSFTAIAAIDAPHNASNNISCGSCHGAALLNSPFWGGSYTPQNINDTVFNKLCLNCHRRSSGGPYSQTDAPAVTTHSDSSGSALAECRDCHNPHYQRQKVCKNTDASNLYLATGTITSNTYNSEDNTTELSYSTITYKGWITQRFF